MSYPKDRAGDGFAIRFIKALLASDAIRNYGTEVVMLVIFIVSREDRLHYKQAPRFWRAEIMDRFGWKSPKQFRRVIETATLSGLLHYTPGNRTCPGLYWVTVADWLPADPFRKRNGKSLFRSEYGTRNGTESGTESGTLSIPSTNNTHVRAPSKGKTGSFSKPSLEDIQAYCRERNNSVDAQAWLDHYTANGWRVGRNAMKDWRAAVRTWERNGVRSGNGSSPEPDYRDLSKGRGIA